MKTLAEFITRHRRMLLIALLSVTMLVSSALNRRRLEEDAVLTSLPVTQVPAGRSDPVSAYISGRDAAHQQDVEALSSLIARDDIDPLTRERAAEEMCELIRHREAQDALEAALASTDLAPCTAVVTDRAVTIVTGKTLLTPEDSALILTLAAAHADADPEDVHVMTAQ